MLCKSSCMGRTEGQLVGPSEHLILMEISQEGEETLHFSFFWLVIGTLH